MTAPTGIAPRTRAEPANGSAPGEARSAVDGGPLSPDPSGRTARPTNGHPGRSPTTTEIPPARAEGVALLGRFSQSGHRTPPSMVRRADGQIIQFTPLLYGVLEAVDGRRDYEEIADVVGQRVGKDIKPEQVRVLTEEKLRPLGVLQQPDGTSPAVHRANPLLGIRLRKVVTDPTVTRRISAPFSAFFFPPVVITTVIAFIAACTWLLFDRGLAQGARQAFYDPGLLLLLFALMLLSSGFHELGHAAACRYGGATPGAMGVGLYLIWPAFYTDVTDAYRLSRGARLRVDLGGVYFNALFALGALGLWAWTGWEALLMVIPLQLFQMLRQMVPFARYDGYHILADLTGVPDLFAHIKPILRGMLPKNWGSEENKALRPAVRATVTIWVLLVVPILLGLFLVMILTLPRLVATAWDSAGMQFEMLRGNWDQGDVAGVAAKFLSICALGIPVLSMAYLSATVIRRTSRRVWRATSDRPVSRVAAILVAAGLIVALVVAWWPDDSYRPIQSDERGTVTELAQPAVIAEEPLVALVSGEPAPAPVSYGEAAAYPIHVEAPVRSRELAGTPLSPANEPGEVPTPPTNIDQGFRYAPLPEIKEGDNQAAAVNYEDGTMLMDVALSLIFETDNVVDNSNQAWALASCTDCASIAIAFQVVLMLDTANIAIPENIAVAVNTYCTNCFTYAVAMQLIVTIPEKLTDEKMAELMEIWGRVQKVKKNIGDIPLEQVEAILLSLQMEILDVLTEDGDTAPADGASPLPEGSEDDPAPTASQGPTSEPSSPTSEPSAGPGSDPSSDPSTDPTTEPSAEGSPAPSPSPDPSPSAEPSSEPVGGTAETTTP